MKKGESSCNNPAHAPRFREPAQHQQPSFSNLMRMQISGLKGSGSKLLFDIPVIRMHIFSS